MTSSDHKILVLRAAGTNCDEETAFAFAKAGATVERVHVGRFLSGERSLGEFSVLVIPGGFSYGDDLGAGTVLANQLATRMRDELSEFVAAGRLVLGICNGFQVLVRLGLLPGWDDDSKCVSLVVNDSGKFEDRWVHLRVDTERCPFLRTTTDVEADRSALLRLPVAHKEGRFLTRDAGVLQRLESEGQVALRYALPSGELAGDEHYPANPNGSVGSIAGITNPTGNVLGLMPHPERFIRFLQDPQWTRRAAENGIPAGEDTAGDGFRFFAGALAHLGAPAC